MEKKTRNRRQILLLEEKSIFNKINRELDLLLILTDAN